MLKRGYMGTYHRISPNHAPRSVTGLSGLHKDCDSDTADRMSHNV